MYEYHSHDPFSCFQDKTFASNSVHSTVDQTNNTTSAAYSPDTNSHCQQPSCDDTLTEDNLMSEYHSEEELLGPSANEFLPMEKKSTPIFRDSVSYTFEKRYVSPSLQEEFNGVAVNGCSGPLRGATFRSEHFFCANQTNLNLYSVPHVAEGSASKKQLVENASQALNSSVSTRMVNKSVQVNRKRKAQRQPTGAPAQTRKKQRSNAQKWSSCRAQATVVAQERHEKVANYFESENLIRAAYKHYIRCAPTVIETPADIEEEIQKADGDVTTLTTLIAQRIGLLNPKYAENDAWIHDFDLSCRSKMCLFCISLKNFTTTKKSNSWRNTAKAREAVKAEIVKTMENFQPVAEKPPKLSFHSSIGATCIRSMFVNYFHLVEEKRASGDGVQEHSPEQLNDVREYPMSCPLCSFKPRQQKSRRKDGQKSSLIKHAETCRGKMIKM